MRQFAEANRAFTICGPTCDTMDVLPGTIDLREDIRRGDWIEFDLLGAYGNALSTRFNGFDVDRWVRIEEPEQ